MIVAINVALDPKWTPCGDCACIDGQANVERWEIPGVLPPTRICPRRSVTSDAWQWLDLFKHYQIGQLARAGGVLDQPHAYLQAMALINDWLKREHAK